MPGRNLAYCGADFMLVLTNHNSLLPTRTAFLVGVADIDKGGIAEPVGRGFRKTGLGARLAIGAPGPPGHVDPAHDHDVDHAAAAEFGGVIGVGGRRPHRRMRLLVGPRPDVDVAVGEMLALPAERAVVMGQGLVDQVDRLPEALADADRVGVARGHLGAARFDKADFEPAARDDVGGRVFLGGAHRVLAHRDQVPMLSSRIFLVCRATMPRIDRARAIEAIDPGMVLARGDVEPELVAQQVLVERFLEQPRRDFGIAIAVGQAGAHRIGARRAPRRARTGTGSRNETTRPYRARSIELGSVGGAMLRQLPCRRKYRMTLELRQLHPLFAAEVDGIDLAQPVDAATVDAIWQAIDRYAVLVFRDQRLTTRNCAISPPVRPAGDRPRGGARRPAAPGASADRRYLQPRRGQPGARARRPAPARQPRQPAVAHRCVVHAGAGRAGDAACGGGAAGQRLGRRRDRIRRHARGLRCVARERRGRRSTSWSSSTTSSGRAARSALPNFAPGEREKYPPSPQRLVRRHPGSGRKTLYLSAHASHIVGWPVADGRILLSTSMCTRPSRNSSTATNGGSAIW